ncbi:inosine triphosphate pyrophosphatase [Vairimorpha necatrix]|uniref:Inosine triphosphate pyrophosphatase n=1 Tax=Vairimorpha necatrix TaxID=6039 RepID=A0AAX4JEV8_9MICR
MLIYFVTSSFLKFKEVVDNYNLNFSQLNIPLTEIQGTQDQIALHKLKTACQIYPDKWIMVDDTSIEIIALNGFPGPYGKDFLSIGIDCIENLVSKIGRDTKLSCVIGLGNEKLKIFKLFNGNLKGKIVKREKNEYCEFDGFFVPDGFDIPYSDLSNDVKRLISHRGMAMRKMEMYIKEKEF